MDVVAYCELYDSSKLDEARKLFPRAGTYDNVDDLIASEDFDLACVILQPRDMPDALYVQQSIDAAYESARTGRRVEVRYGL